MNRKNIIFWVLQLIFDFSMLIVLLYNNNFNKYKENEVYSIYTPAVSYVVMEKPEETFDYLSAADNIKEIYVKYKDDKIICRIIGWNGKLTTLEFNRTDLIVIDYL